MSTLIQLEVDEATALAMDQAAASEGIDRDQWLRQLLASHLPCDPPAAKPTPWELGKDLFGQHGSGRSDQSQNVESLVREKIHAKHARRRRG